MCLHVTIKAVFATAFGLLALIAVGQNVLSIIKLAVSHQSVTEVAPNWLPSVVTLNKIRAGTAELRIKQRASEDTGAAASQVLNAASELSRQSVHLGGEVDRFLATVRAA